MGEEIEAIDYSTKKNTEFKPGMQSDGQLKDFPGGNEKGFLGGSKAAKAFLKSLQLLGQPSIAAGFGIDELRKGNIKTAGSMLLAPEFVGSFAPAGKGILSTIGRVAANPFGKAVRAFTPVGLATIAGGAGYDVYKEIERRQELTDEERLQEDIEAQAKDDEMMVGAAEGGRIGFAVGGPLSLKIIYIIMDRLRNLKNSTFSNYNQVRMYGEQKGITELLEPYKNIPNKNRLNDAIDDAEELKKFMPDEYKSILDEIIDDTKQFKFKTAHDKQQALEKALPKEFKFENLPEEMFPMPNPENPNFIVPYGYPDKNPFQKSRNLTRTEADKFTGKGTRKTYDTFNEKTKQYQEPSENTLISEEPIDEELESIIRDLDKGDLQ